MVRAVRTAAATRGARSRPRSRGVSRAISHPSVIWPSHEPRFFSSERSDDEERIFPEPSSTRAFCSVELSIAR